MHVIGGALNISFSNNVSVVSSNFAHNEAETTGVMAILESNLHIIQSNFSHNRAYNSSGVIFSDGSSISTDKVISVTTEQVYLEE